jgi:predicted DNA-binding transcriptional regulator AlpA
MQQPTATVAPASDGLADFDYVATQIFLPSRGRKVGITRNGLALMIERGAFPRPIRLGDGPKARMYWRVSELQRWVSTRKAA